jgi:hypothetical protein
VGICEIGFCGNVWLVRKVVESKRKWKLLLKLELSMLFFGPLEIDIYGGCIKKQSREPFPLFF